MILHTYLVMGSTNFIGIMNQVSCIDNSFNLNFQPMFTTCCEQFQKLVLIFKPHKINVTNNYIILQRTIHHV
jgi:hypothetical protein